MHLEWKEVALPSVEDDTWDGLVREEQAREAGRGEGPGEETGAGPREAGEYLAITPPLGLDKI